MKPQRNSMCARALFVIASVVAMGLAVPDAAVACTARIGNFVWLDNNRNGVQDVGEPGIASATVRLLAADGVTVLRTVQTDANGYYLFEGDRFIPVPPLCEVQYVVKVETPAGLAPTLIGVGDAATDSNDPGGTFVTPTDVPDFDSIAEDLTIDFGFTPPCTGVIGDFVWNDLNNNGRQDGGELGIASVVMTQGATSTQTNASGAYQFAGLCAGTYTVCAGIPTGFQLSPANATGVDNAQDSDGVSNGQGQSCTTVTLPNDSSSDPTNDFGFWKTMVQSPGTGTPGYWKNHPEAWPVAEITIGGIVYPKDVAIQLMSLPDGDKTQTIFRALVSAKLNVLIGNDASCIASTISAADDWMTAYGPVGSGVKAKTLAWRIGEPLYWQLDAYNNGDLCAPHRD